jgi:hypothetical protein
MDKHRPMEMARHKALAEQEEALQASLEEPSTPEAQLQALYNSSCEARLQADLEHRALVIELNAVLTPDQQAKARRIRDSLRREVEAHRVVLEELGVAGEDCPLPPPPRP